MIWSFLTGFGLSLSLITAIGAQNAFVLRQGIRQEHVLAVVLTCALSDAVLMTAGVTGFGRIAEAYPLIKPVMTYGGAAFLFFYGILSFRSAYLGTSGLQAEECKETALWPTVLICLALTWGNPHVYLDTLVLLGSVAAVHEGSRPVFAFGAVLASFVFFFSLGYGARLLAPFFEKPASWRILDFCVGLLMWVIALSLIIGM